MSRLRILIVLVFACLVVPVPAASAGVLACATMWSAYPVAGPWAALSGVDARRTDDAWAVGLRGAPERTFAMHWNGAAWKDVPTPNVDVGDTLKSNRLEDVWARKAGDVWAVGWREYHGGSRTLITHWNGSKWSVVRSPNRFKVGDNQLLSVSGTAVDDVWAAGWAISGASSIGYIPLVLHWNGVSWSRIGLPITKEEALGGIEAAGRGDVWAVGWRSVATRQRVSIWHWDGDRWTHAPSPAGAPSGGEAALTAVSADGSTDVWAVGTTRPDGVAPQVPLAMHWDGGSWTRADIPVASSDRHWVNDVVTVGPNLAWAVGAYIGDDPALLDSHPLALRWNGTRWRIATTPWSGPDHDETLDAVDQVRGLTWAVGTPSFDATRMVQWRCAT
jgi:hypothetical protein